MQQSCAAHHFFRKDPVEIVTDPNGHEAIPLGMQYSSVLKQGQLLAIADEDGYVSIVDTHDGLPTRLQVSEGEDSKVKAQWLAHRNSIYQIAWTKVCPAECTCVSPQHMRDAQQTCAPTAHVLT